jgi:hypothetical protein
MVVRRVCREREEGRSQFGELQPPPSFPLYCRVYVDVVASSNEKDKDLVMMMTKERCDDSWKMKQSEDEDKFRERHAWKGCWKWNTKEMLSHNIK